MLMTSRQTTMDLVIMNEAEAIYLLIFMFKWLFLPLCIVGLIGEAIDKYLNRKLDPFDWDTRLQNGEELIGGEDGNLFKFDNN